MERTTLCSEKDTRRPKKWNYQGQKYTMRMVYISKEGMLSCSKAWRGETSKINGKEIKKEVHSGWGITTCSSNKEEVSKFCSKRKKNWNQYV